MTPEEFNSLPENGGFYFREENRNGLNVKIPFSREAYVLSPLEYFRDSFGDSWLIGVANGIKYKEKQDYYPDLMLSRRFDLT